HYDVPVTATSGPVVLSLDQVSVSDIQGNAQACPGDPPFLIPCLGATISVVSPPSGTPEPSVSPTATPTVAAATPIVFSSTPSVTPVGAFYVAIDCDVTHAGIQDTCSYPGGQTGPVDVNLVVVNNSGQDSTAAAFNFNLH